MSEFGSEIAARVARTTKSLDAAHAADDDYLASVLYGELESLSRLADEHDVDVPGLRETLRKHGKPVEMHLPDAGLSPRHIDTPTVLDLTVGSEQERRIA